MRYKIKKVDKYIHIYTPTHIHTYIYTYAYIMNQQFNAHLQQKELLGFSG